MSFRRIYVLGCGALLCVSLVLLFAVGITAKSDANGSSWGFSLTNMDTTCKPCDDFYQFAMGGWMKSNPIPPEYPSWGTFTELRDKNLSAMRTILEDAAKANAPAGSAVASRAERDKQLAAASGDRPRNHAPRTRKSITDCSLISSALPKCVRSGRNVDEIAFCPYRL